jgi:hypothetical protein
MDGNSQIVTDLMHQHHVARKYTMLYVVSFYLVENLFATKSGFGKII